jgi:hypothetical protein
VLQSQIARELEVRRTTEATRRGIAQMRRVCGSALLVGVVAAFGLAAGPAAAADCPNAAIRAQQGVEGLPDCMAVEMVSPPRKFSQNARMVSVSADGGRALFQTGGGIGDPPGMVDVFWGDLYVASRGVGGWDASATVPPDLPGDGWNLSEGWSGGTQLQRSHSPDFSRWLTIASTPAQMDAGISTAFAGGLGGFFEPWSPLLAPLDAQHNRTNVVSTELKGASADHSRFFFQPGDLGTAYLAGDPSPAGPDVPGVAVTTTDPNVYVAGPDGGGVPSLELLARDSDGRVWGARCGARVGGGFFSTIANSGRDQGAVSYPDGGRVYFQTRPGQSGAGVCDTATNRLRIMRRVETDAGPWISQLLESECDRVAPACDVTDGDDLFQGASVDGQKVYFTTSRQLADTDLDSGSSCSAAVAAAGCDLYLYDASLPVGQRLVQVSAGDETNPTPGAGAGVLDEIAAISGDGSHVYFVADGVLTTAPGPTGAVAAAGQRNLYLYQRDSAHPDGRIAFIGAAAASDGDGKLWASPSTFKGRAYPVPVTGKNSEGEEIGGDGRLFVFQSDAAFTADDSDGGETDVYRYDSGSHQIERISKALPGGADNGPFDIRAGTGTNPTVVGTAFGEIGRWVSEDAETIVMRTEEGWAADDTNGVMDAYMWRDGQVYRLPGSSDATLLADRFDRQPSMSHDGSVVAYLTPQQALPQDGDSAADVYVVRVDGGYPAPVPGIDCDPLASGGCHGGGVGETGSDRRTDTGSSGNAVAGDRVRVAVGGLTATQRKRAANSGVLALRVRASRAQRVRVIVRGRVGNRSRRLGHTLRMVGPRTSIVRVRLAKAARQRLADGQRLRLSVRVGADGARQRSLTVVLRRTGK